MLRALVLSCLLLVSATGRRTKNFDFDSIEKEFNLRAPVKERSEFDEFSLPKFNKDPTTKVKFDRSSLQKVQDSDPDCKYGFKFLERLIRENAEKRLRGGLRHRLPVTLQHSVSGALVQDNNMCADTMDGVEGSNIGVYDCHGLGRNQEFTLTPSKNILAGELGKRCISVNENENDEVILKKCHPDDSSMKWNIHSRQGWFVPVTRPGYCITTTQSATEDRLTLRKCVPGTRSQVWQMEMTQVLFLKQQLRKPPNLKLTA